MFIDAMDGTVVLQRALHHGENFGVGELLPVEAGLVDREVEVIRVGPGGPAKGRLHGALRIKDRETAVRSSRPLM